MWLVRQNLLAYPTAEIRSSESRQKRRNPSFNPPNPLETFASETSRSTLSSAWVSNRASYLLTASSLTVPRLRPLNLVPLTKKFLCNIIYARKASRLSWFTPTPTLPILASPPYLDIPTCKLAGTRFILSIRPLLGPQFSVFIGGDHKPP